MINFIWYVNNKPIITESFFDSYNEAHEYATSIIKFLPKGVIRIDIFNDIELFTVSLGYDLDILSD